MSIVISEKHRVVLDPKTLKVGMALPDVYILDISPIEEKIKELDIIADDLIGCLDPTTGMLNSQPNREGALSRAGFLTMMMVGLTIGLGMIALVLLSIE
ncbi:MAG: tetrahydromethanopterin S-methyltransferase subunit B [Candidatus Methanoliparum thermophilum]|uniref:Tetrahydromethanopterin S-methyltransferase subunit B n=1 Tax=Methanoliparum thermophilum TaxID=2491083 RepID=A0A520KSM6_METT2|nr:tetrahydromethanopterin S-methyltransferase subunit B [Candidatus Methanoliparum sp. LAM-1]RZN64928.1 MAG: tetrahydromethanopterin S-methyltransferase subunit B [Candidatus Methanoliparum thermophilum]BDC36192.1 tetrahydromethanopterin S-methyltransferase subunit B [Candidatus Methanoliparum sp. LAM-1]